MEKFNETYATRHKKYPLNIPIELFEQAKMKSKQAGFIELAPYLRAIISKEVNDGNMRIQDILGEKETKRQEYLVKEKKMQPRESPKYFFIRLNAKNFLDKVLNRQVYFKW